MILERATALLLVAGHECDRGNVGGYRLYWLSMLLTAANGAIIAGVLYKVGRAGHWVI